VPLSEALVMFNKVRAKGLDTWLVVGEQEGHGYVTFLANRSKSYLLLPSFRQKSCIKFVDASKAAFLRKWLLT